MLACTAEEPELLALPPDDAPLPLGQACDTTGGQPGRNSLVVIAGLGPLLLYVHPSPVGRGRRAASGTRCGPGEGTSFIRKPPHPTSPGPSPGKVDLSPLGRGGIAAIGENGRR